MTSFIVYQILDVWVPSICVSLIFFSVFAIVLLKIGWKLHQGKKNLVPRWFFEMLRLAFRDLKRESDGRITIFDKEIGRLSFALLVAITVPIILSACFITFWNIYMVDELIGDQCHPSYDCFPVRGDKLLETTPVQNCSQSWDPDIKFRCYQLVYSYAQGVSATGGILFFASVMFKIFTVTLLVPHNIENVYCKWACYTAVISVGISVPIVFILLHTTIRLFHDTVFRTVTFQIQFALYSFLFFVVFVISGPLLIFGIECEAVRRKNRSQDSNIAV